MGSRAGQKIKLTSVDELLCVPDFTGARDLPVDNIRPFKNHPFKVIDDEKMEELIDSIRVNGVLTPVIVRPVQGGIYEMISGHRRLYAAEKAGLKKIPAIVREVSNDEAVIMMVDSNCQREELLPSEKAFAYKMRYEAMRRQGKRNDRTSSLIGTRSRADEQLAKDVGESRNQIQRLMRLTELIPELLNLVDEKKIALYTGVELSFLPKEPQLWIHSYMKEKGFLQAADIAALRRGEDMDDLTKNKVYKFLDSLQVLSDRKTSSKLSIPGRILDKYFPMTMNSKDREKVILALLEKWKREQETQ